MITLTPWMSGTPALIGWFNASTERSPDARRYWNGEHWSAPVYVGDPDGHAERARNTPSESPASEIEWRGLELDRVDPATRRAITRVRRALQTFDSNQRLLRRLLESNPQSAKVLDATEARMGALLGSAKSLPL